MLAMITKEFRQMRRDHRTVAMMVMMPVVLLLVFGYAASFDVSSIPTAVVGPGADQITSALPPVLDPIEVDESADRAVAEELLVDAEVGLALVSDGSGVTALVDGAELFQAQAAQQILLEAGESFPALETEILFNPDLDTSATLVPGLGGLILIFVGTLLTSLGVVKERQAGTLDQLAVMPIRSSDVIVGKIAPYFLVAAFDLAVVLLIGRLLFDVPFNGSLPTLMVGAVLFLLVTLGLGVLISTLSQNQGQAIQLALMTLLPQVLLSGIIFPLSSMPIGVRWIGYLLPLTYFNMIAKGVMLRGASLVSLWFPFLLLAVLAVVVFGLATARFAADLSPARSADREVV